MSKLSIVVPVYFNEDTLELLYNDLYEKVLNTIEDYELIFVDDGSGDNSWDEILKLQKNDSKIVSVKLSRNFGEHAAILAGLTVSTGDCAVTKQADLQEDSLIILEMYNSWKKGNDVVLAVREDREDTFFTKLFAGAYYRLVNRYIDKNMPTGGCDCYLLDRKVIKVLASMKEKNSSLTLQVLWSGFKTDKIYFKRLERKVGHGRWTFSKKFKLVMDSFISFSYMPIRLVWVVGLLFFLFSIVLGISIIIEYVTIGTPVAGWTSLMSVLLCAFGLILLMLGVLGEYIWRIFDASRERPPFIIDIINKDNDENNKVRE